MSDHELLHALRPSVEKLNKDSQDHVRILVEMLISMPHQNEPLPKSSEGAIIQNAANARFEEDILKALGYRAINKPDLLKMRTCQNTLPITFDHIYRNLLP